MKGRGFLPRQTGEGTDLLPVRVPGSGELKPEKGHQDGAAALVIAEAAAGGTDQGPAIGQFTLQPAVEEREIGIAARLCFPKIPSALPCKDLRHLGKLAPCVRITGLSVNGFVSPRKI